MTAREKVLNLEQQVIALAQRGGMCPQCDGNGKVGLYESIAVACASCGGQGKIKQINCPFCGLMTVYCQALCCNECADLTEIILDHIDFKEGMERTERIMDRFANMKTSALVH